MTLARPLRRMDGTAQVLRIAGPMILAGLSQPLAALVGAVIAAHLPQADDLAGVAVGGSVLTLVLWGLVFLRMSTVGLTAQRAGADDGPGQIVVLARAALIAFTLGTAIALAAGPVSRGLIWLIGPGAEVAGAAGLYTRIRLIAMPAALCNLVIAGHLLGTGRPRLCLVLQLVASAANIGLASALVFGAGLGISGIAMAAAMADVIAFAFGVALVVPGLRGRRLPDLPEVFEPRALLDFLRLSRDFLLRSLSLIAVQFWITRAAAQLGTEALGANALLFTLLSCAGLVIDGFSSAAQVLVGRAAGGNDPAGLRQNANLCLMAGAGAAAVMALLLVLLGRGLLAAMTVHSEVADLAAMQLPILALIVLASAPAFVFDGIFIGLTRPRAAMLVVFCASLVCLSALALLVPRFGSHGLWLAYAAFMASRAAGMAMIWRRMA